MKIFLQAINVFCLLISVFVIGVYCTYCHVGSHIVYTDIIKVMSLGIIFMTIPSLLGEFFGKAKDDLYLESQYTIGLFLLGSALGFCSHWLNLNISPLIVLFGVAGLITFFFRHFKLLKDVKIWMWCLIIIFAVIFALVITSQYYVITTPTSPLLIPRLILGIDTVDQEYLAGIANIISTYSIPSWGVDGLSYLHYHWGSIWFLAMFGALLNISVIKSYVLLYPAIFVPLMFKALFLFCRQIVKMFQPVIFYEKKLIIINIIIVGLAISFIYPLSLFQLQSEVGSDSYAIALFFAFLLATIIISVSKNSMIFTKMKKTDILIITLELPAVLFLIGMAKVSVFYDVVLLYFYFVFRTKLYSRITFLTSGTLILLIMGLVYYLCQYGSPVGELIVRPFDYLKLGNNHTYQGLIRLNHFPMFAHLYSIAICIGHFSVFYFWSWLFFISKYVYHKLSQNKNLAINIPKTSMSNMKYFDMEIIVFLFLINGLVGYSLYITGGSVFYFLDITRWVSIAFFFGVLTQVISFCNYGDKNIISLEQ